MKLILRSPLVWLGIFCAIPLWSFLFPGLPHTHDGTIHVARIANFYQSLFEGNIIPRWAANLNWGYGTPILMFVYPLPSYVASLFHAVGLSLVDSTKLLFAVSYIASALTMYLWVRSHWGQFPGIVAAIIYAFAPYRFVDLFVRGALGEHMAFIFPPLICWGLYKLSRFPKRSTLLIPLVAISTAGLILTHNALSVMFLPLIVLYGIYLYLVDNKNKRFLLQGLTALVWGFLLSAFFWFPALYEQKYTLIDKVTSGTASGRFTPWSWFVYSPWNYGGGNQVTKQLGPLTWLAIITGVLFLLRRKHGINTWFVAGSLAMIGVSLFLMTGQSAFVWDSVGLLEKFQFPWRFLSAVIFVGALLGGYVTTFLPGKRKTVIVLLLVVGIVYTIPQWHPKGYIQEQESYFTDVFFSTTDSGEASPVWSVRFMLVPAKSPMEIINGNATWEEVSRTTINHHYTVDAETKVKIVENTLYFPGWEVLVDGNPVQTEFQDAAHRGLMTYWVPPGKHDVLVRFGDTKVRSFANGISLAAWFGLGIWHIMRRRLVSYVRKNS